MNFEPPELAQVRREPTSLFGVITETISGNAVGSVLDVGVDGTPVLAAAQRPAFR
jgi:hypothetical protein